MANEQELLSDEQLNEAFDGDFEEVHFDHKPTAEDILLIKLKLVAKAQIAKLKDMGYKSPEEVKELSKHIAKRTGQVTRLAAELRECVKWDREKVARKLCPDKAGWDANDRDVYVDHEKYRKQADQLKEKLTGGEDMTEQKDRPDREKKALERIVLFLSIAQETGHKCLYLDVWGNARTLLNDLNALFPDRAQTMDSPDREKIARVICCFANENESCADCKENHPGSLFPDCFSDIREHTDQLLALFPDREELEKQATLEQAAFDQLNFDKERVAFWARIEEAKREGYTIGFEEARKKYELDNLPYRESNGR